MSLNYSHLRYFREVAALGNLTRAAERLNLSQSALSTQIKQLELRLGHDLFERVGRKLILTEAGRIALDHAERIFETGDELVASLDQSARPDQPLRIGAVSTLSRNFQIAFLRKALGPDAPHLTLMSGDMAGLLRQLNDLSMDVVLTTEPPIEAETGRLQARLIDQQAVKLIGRCELLRGHTLRDLIETAPLIVPTDNRIRQGLSELAHKLNVTPHIFADVDDMAMVRLLTVEGAGVALAPTVVLAGEIATGEVTTVDADLRLTQDFYAVTLKRKYPHPKVKLLLPDGDA